MESFIPFSRPSFDENEENELLQTLRSGWITTGPRVKLFEAELAAYLELPEIVALSSCTAALHLSYLLAELGAGDEVLTPSLTFASTANMILATGARPIFVDVDQKTLTISPEDAESKITDHTKAIVAVDYAGNPADYGALRAICDRHGLVLVEDAAHACGAEYEGKKLGAIADFTCFSFYANKNMTMAEGGALAARDPKLLSRARVMALHGMDKDAWKRYDRSGSWRYEISELGFKYNLTDIQAALGIHKLRKLPSFNKRRSEIVERYRTELCDVPRIRMLDWPLNTKATPYLAVLLVEPDARLNRDSLVENLSVRGVGTSVHFIPLHLQPLYSRMRRVSLPHTEAAFERILSLPNFPSMTDGDVSRVIEVIRELET